jgi:hypothetical protein
MIFYEFIKGWNKAKGGMRYAFPPYGLRSQFAFFPPFFTHFGDLF